MEGDFKDLRRVKLVEFRSKKEIIKQTEAKTMLNASSTTGTLICGRNRDKLGLEGVELLLRRVLEVLVQTRVDNEEYIGNGDGCFGDIG